MDRRADTVAGMQQSRDGTGEARHTGMLSTFLIEEEGAGGAGQEGTSSVTGRERRGGKMERDYQIQHGRYGWEQ